MGNGYRSIEGFTTINTPTDEDLYCEFTINDEGDVTLKFADGKTVDILADMMSGRGAFSGLELRWNPKKT